MGNKKEKIRKAIYRYRYMLDKYRFVEFVETVVDEIDRELKEEEDGKV